MVKDPLEILKKFWGYDTFKRNQLEIIKDDFNDINGGAGYNIVGENGLAGNRYNLKFNIARRTYNQTTLLNTYDQLKPIKSYSDVSKVIDIKFGDLNRYKSPLMNVEVTRLNPKTHIESSISVLNSNMHI